MRTRVNNGKPVLYFETNDAGALFRFTDMYQRMVGGKMWVGMDPPNQDGSAQEGVINVSAFSIRGDSTLERVVSNAPNASQNNNIDFSQARADFTRAPGRMMVRDGVLRGPMLGATVEGKSITPAIRSRCAARWCRSTASTTCSAKFRSSACSSAAAATRACSASPTR
jgi:hypothetical protein